MQITVKGKGMDVGEALTGHITQSLNEHLKRYFDRSLDVHVTATKQADEFTFDLALHVPGEILPAHGQADDAYAAFDIAADKLYAQVKKYKSRLRDHHKDDTKRDGMVTKTVSA